MLILRFHDIYRIFNAIIKVGRQMQSDGENAVLIPPENNNKSMFYI